MSLHLVTFGLVSLLLLSFLSLSFGLPSRFHRNIDKVSSGSQVNALLPVDDIESTAATCNVSKHETEGPYWVEENLNRYNLTEGTSVSGIPLWIKIIAYNVSSSNSSCDILGGAKVDLWHCDVGGLYSDEQQLGTQGQKWLRGHQITDASGTATFYTWYPGWYTGRTVHIHVRIRLYDSNGKLTYDDTTQAYFDDTLTDQVYTAAPYNKRPSRSTRNARDNLYLLSQEYTVTGDNIQGYTASAAYGVPFSK